MVGEAAGGELNDEFGVEANDGFAERTTDGRVSVTTLSPPAMVSSSEWMQSEPKA